MSTTTTLRPNTELANNSWTYSTLASADTLTSDNSNTTYIQSPTTPDKAIRMGFTDPTALPPTGTARTRLKVRVKAARATAGSPDNLLIWLQYTGDGSFMGALDVMVSSTTPTDYTSGWIYAPPISGSPVPEWHWTRLLGLEARIFVKRGPNTTQSLAVRVYEVYIDIENSDNSITTIVAPSGTITVTNKPDIHFTVADTEGDVANGYSMEIKSADGVTSYWDSGEVDVFDATDLTIPTTEALDNIPTGYKVFGYTYRALPNGSRLATATTSGPTFLVVPVEVPSATITTSFDIVNDVPAYKMTVTSRLNLLSLVDSTFVDGVGTWVAIGSTTIVLNTTGGVDDTTRLRLTRTSGTGAMVTTTGFYSLPYKENHLGAPLKVSASVKVISGSTGRTATLFIDCYNATSTLIASISSTPTVDNSSTWVELSASGDIPIGTTTAKLRVNFMSVPITEPHYVDTVALHFGGPAMYNIGGRTFNSIDRSVIAITDFDGRVIVSQELQVELDSMTVVVTDPVLQYGVARNYIATNSAADGLVTSETIVVMGPHIAQFSGWWLKAEGKEGITVNLIGNTFKTEYWEEAAEFVPLGRSDTITITDGGRLPRRSFILEVFNLESAEILRRLLTESEGSFWLMGTWPQVEAARYRVRGPVTEDVENSDPDIFQFTIDTQMVDKL